MAAPVTATSDVAMAGSVTNRRNDFVTCVVISKIHSGKHSEGLVGMDRLRLARLPVVKAPLAKRRPYWRAGLKWRTTNQHAKRHQSGSYCIIDLHTTA